MEAYSPYDALAHGGRYPALLLVHGAHDARVPLSHSLKYASRVRARAAAADGRDPAAPPPPPALVHVREYGGHFGDGGRYRRFEQASMELAFLMRAVGEDAAA